MTGKKCGKLTAVSMITERIRGAVMWNCVCDCGSEYIADGRQLRNGRTFSCGCVRREVVDMSGVTCGKLTVLSRASRSGSSRSAMWNCMCECGTLVTCSGDKLRRGHTKSCGCIRGETLLARNLELNPESGNARDRRLRDNHERAGVRREYPKKELVIERDGPVCGICGLYVDENDWHLDHVIPVTRDGLDLYSNVQVSHPSCNIRKNNKLQEDDE